MKTNVRKPKLLIGIALTLTLVMLAGCGKDKASPDPSSTNPPSSPGAVSTQPSPETSPTVSPNPTASPSASAAPTTGGKTSPSPTGGGKGGATATPSDPAATKPESVSVLVNKQFALPDSYNPSDLVYPDVPFTFKEQIEKRKMRKEAAGALEQMFAGAKKDGIYLAGVSAYRSHATQTSLFNQYVKKDGEEKAKTYSAVPGHSEHETGLAIDVSGSDGKCAADDCFGGTKEANWLAKHATEYGFIIRYPKGKESITGYQYEPWHIRYVGTKISKEIGSKNSTLEEYYNAVPVSGK